MTRWRFNRGPEWDAAVRRVAEDMARSVAKANASSWREAAFKSGRSRQIYEALQAELTQTGIRGELQRIANRNARLIRSVPDEIATRITLEAARLQQEGARPEEIARKIRAWAPQLTKSKIALIARTETSRAETEVTKVRAQKIGIEWAVWQTSQDQRVRASHRNMNGVLVNWSDPPSPEALIGEKSMLGRYLPGACPNCRCVSLPVADLSEIQFPARVYREGSITRMSRPQFAKLSGIPVAA